MDAFTNDSYWGGLVYLNYLNCSNSTAIDNGEVRIQFLDAINFVGYRRSDIMDSEFGISALISDIVRAVKQAVGILIIIVVSIIIYQTYKKRKELNRGTEQWQCYI